MSNGVALPRPTRPCPPAEPGSPGGPPTAATRARMPADPAQPAGRREATPAEHATEPPAAPAACISPTRCRSRAGSVTGSEQRIRRRRGPAGPSRLRRRLRRMAVVERRRVGRRADAAVEIRHPQGLVAQRLASLSVTTIVKPRRCRSRALRIDAWSIAAGRAIATQGRQGPLGELPVPVVARDLGEADQRLREDAVGVRHRVVRRRKRPDEEAVRVLGGHGEKAACSRTR